MDWLEQPLPYQIVGALFLILGFYKLHQARIRTWMIWFDRQGRPREEWGPTFLLIGFYLLLISFVPGLD